MRHSTLLVAFLLATLANHAQNRYEHIFAIGQAGATLLGSDSAIYQWGTNGATGTSVYGVKSDAGGNTIWQRQYTIAGLGNNIAVSDAKSDGTGTMIVLVRTGAAFGILSIDTGGTVLSADIYSPPAPFAAIDMALDAEGNRYVTSDLFRVIKISASGDVIWAKAYANEGSVWSGYGDDDIGGILITSTGTLMLSARSHRDSDILPPSPRQRITLHELDTAGSLLQSWSWRDTLPNESSWNIQPGKLLQRTDGQVILTGRINPGIASVPFVIHLDPSHQIGWMRIVNSPFGGVYRYDVALMPDARILLGHDLSAADAALTMLSPSGAQLWSRRYHYTTLNAHIANLLPTSDVGVIWSGDKHLVWNSNQLYLMRLDSTFSWPCYEYSFALNNTDYDPVPQPQTMYSVSPLLAAHVPTPTTAVAITEQWGGCSSTPILSNGPSGMLVVRSSLADEHVVIDHPQARNALIRIANANGAAVLSVQAQGTSTRIGTSGMAKGAYTITWADDDGARMHARMVVAH